MQHASVTRRLAAVPVMRPVEADTCTQQDDRKTVAWVGAGTSAANAGLCAYQADKLGLDKKQAGARVVKVKMGSASFMAGLRPDDVIQRVGGEKIEGAKDFARMVKATAHGGVLRLFVLREGTSLFIALTRP